MWFLIKISGNNLTNTELSPLLSSSQPSQGTGGITKSVMTSLFVDEIICLKYFLNCMHLILYVFRITLCIWFEKFVQMLD